MHEFEARTTKVVLCGWLFMSSLIVVMFIEIMHFSSILRWFILFLYIFIINSSSSLS